MGSARRDAARRHLLSAVTHGRVVTLAQVEVGVETKETRHSRPLLAPLDLTSAVITLDLLHSVKANIGGTAFPRARLAIRVHNRRKERGRLETREGCLRRHQP